MNFTSAELLVLQEAIVWFSLGYVSPLYNVSLFVILNLTCQSISNVPVHVLPALLKLGESDHRVLVS